MWSYSCYDDGKQPNPWQRWYSATEAARGSHDAVFRILEQRETWGPTQTRPLGKGLIEVKLSGADHVEYRIFGCYKKHSSKHFIITGLGSKKGNVYKPKTILETARGRMKEIEKGSLEALPCVRPTEP